MPGETVRPDPADSVFRRIVVSNDENRPGHRLAAALMGCQSWVVRGHSPRLAQSTELGILGLEPAAHESGQGSLRRFPVRGARNRPGQTREPG